MRRLLQELKFRLDNRTFTMITSDSDSVDNRTRSVSAFVRLHVLRQTFAL